MTRDITCHLKISLRSRMSERLKWISPKNTSQIQWAWGYLKEKSSASVFRHTRYIGETAYQQLIEWDQGQPESAEYREFLGRMRGAWAQRKYRGKKKDKRAYSIVLPVKTKQQLDRISKELSLSLAETIEKLIPWSKEQQEVYFYNERLKSKINTSSDDNLRRNADDYKKNAEIFSKLLTLSLIDLNIFKTRHSPQLDSESNISEIERITTNLLEEFIKEGNNGLSRRMSTISLKSQAVTPKRALIEQRLKLCVHASDQITLTTENNPTIIPSPETYKFQQQPLLNFNEQQLADLKKVSAAFTKKNEH